MRLNLKKTVIASLLCTGGACFAQMNDMQKMVLEHQSQGSSTPAPVVSSTQVATEKQTSPKETTTIIKETKVTTEKKITPKNSPIAVVNPEPVMSLGSPVVQAPSCPCQIQKPVVKHKVYHKKVIKKTVIKKEDEINLVSKHTTEETQTIVTTTKVAPQLVLQVSAIKDSGNPRIVIQAMTQDGQPYEETNLNQSNGGDFRVYNLTTDFTKFSSDSVALNQEYQPQWKSGECHALFIEYKLMGDEQDHGKTFFLDKKGRLTDVLPSKCSLTDKYAEDNTDYSVHDVITQFGFTTPATFHDKPFEYLLHTSKGGQDFFGDELNSFAVSYDFQKLYILKATPNVQGPFYGTILRHDPVPAGGYYTVVAYKHENLPEVTVAKRIVN